MRYIDKASAIKKANMRLNENFGDNGDGEQEMFIGIEEFLIGREKEYGPMTTKQIISTAIDLARESNDLRTGSIASVLDYILKGRY